MRGTSLIRLAPFLLLGLAVSCGGSRDGHGPADTVRLRVALGPGSPGTTQVLPGSTDVAVLQISLQAFDADVEVGSLRLHASGSGDDAAEVSSARLYLDADGSGDLGAPDTLLGSPAAYASDDGDLLFSGLGETIPRNSRVEWLLLYDIGIGPATGDTFCAAVTDPGDVTATIGGLRALVEIGTAIQGCVDALVPDLAVQLGPSSPGGTQVAPGSTDAAVLQLSLRAIGADVDVTDIRFHASGSGNDVTDIGSAWLYRDVDGSGDLGAPDVLLGSPRAYSTDDGDLLYSGLSETIPAGSSVYWLLIYHIDFDSWGGDDFCAEIRDETDVGAFVGGSPAFVGVLPGIQDCVGVQPVFLKVRPGRNNPLRTLALPGDTDLSVLQFTLEVGSWDVDVWSARFHASGTGDDALDITGARLYRDADGDGRLGPVDLLLGPTTLYPVDDGELVFPALGLTIPAATTQDWLLVYDLGTGAVSGDIFWATITDAGDVTASSVGPGAVQILEPVVAGSIEAYVPALLVRLGPNSPGVGIVSPASIGAPVLQLTLEAGPADVDVTGIRFRAYDWGADHLDINEARLYRDVDGDGRVGASDVLLAPGMTYLLDDGVLDFTSLTEVIPASSLVTWLLVYDLDARAGAHERYCTRIWDSSDVTAEVGGVPIAAAVEVLLQDCVEIGFVFLRVLFRGPPNPIPTAPGATDVPVLHLDMWSENYDVDVWSLRIHASGSGDDAANIAAARLYNDTDTSGTVTGSDVLLAGPETFSLDDGDLTFSFSTVIPAWGGQVWLVAYDIGAGAAPGDSFCAGIGPGDVGAFSMGPPASLVVEPGIQGCDTIP